jgi:hypothetical protein
MTYDIPDIVYVTCIIIIDTIILHIHTNDAYYSDIPGRITTSTSSTSGITATVAVDVCTLPCVSVAGTRCTLCTPYVLCIMYYVLCMYILCIIYYILCIIHYLLCIIYYVLFIIYYVLCIMYYVLCIMYYVLCITCVRLLRISFCCIRSCL